MVDQRAEGEGDRGVSNKRKTRLVVSIEERVTDPDRWHPRLRRRVREWSGVHVFTRREGWRKLGVVSELKQTPRGVVEQIRRAAA